MINFKKLVDPYINNFLKTLKYFIEIPSFYEKKTVSKEMPYGQKIDKILTEFAKLGKNLNFNIEKNSRYVELSIGNKGKLIEIFGHLDTVPVTNKKLLKLIIKNNVLFGRGIADDKGPLLACVFAVKILNDHNLINKNKQIKIFAGGDEERGSSCLKYYFKKQKKEKPSYGFTPDSKFPIVYGEKGVGNIIIYKKINFKKIENINGGKTFNIVMPKCTFKVKNINEIKKNSNKIKHNFKINKNSITFFGIAAHASNPYNGENAFLIGLKELIKFSNNNDKKIMEKIYNAFIDYSGKNMNAYFNGKHLKETTYNIGVVNFKKNILTIKIDFRYPENVKPKKITEIILKHLNFKLKNQKYTKFLLHNLTSKLVKSLINAYQIETNDFKNKPLISGGGTYAKECDNIIAFGAEYPNSNYKMHEENESIKKNELINLIIIYMHAIFNLINF